MKKIVIFSLLAFLTGVLTAQQVDYSVVFVKEESGISFTKISSDNDYVCMPEVKRGRKIIIPLINNIY